MLLKRLDYFSRGRGLATWLSPLAKLAQAYSINLPLVGLSSGGCDNQAAPVAVTEEDDIEEVVAMGMI